MNNEWSSEFFKTLRPKPRLTVSEWADKFRKIPAGTSPEPGAWNTSRTPYLKEPMDCLSDHETESVTCMFSSQVGKSEFELNALGYYVDQDPAPILYVLPTLEAAENFSKERIDPMFRDSPSLSGKLDNGKDEKGASRKSSNTIRMKHFPGGYLALVGANSPAGLASRPIRICIFDEIDRFSESAGIEGDPIKLGIQRTTNFYNRKILYVSTPTLEEVSRIYELFLEGDQRHCYLPCPHCNEYQELLWENVKWDRDENGVSLPDTAAYYCKHCGEKIEDRHKAGMLAKLEWRAHAPFKGKASFCLSSLYSPWVKFSALAKEWCDVVHKKDRKGMMEFVNLKLGQPWKAQNENVEYDYLIKRREYYNCEVPEGVLILTCAVDVQDQRFEVKVKGWGHGKESWAIEYKVFYGDPARSKIWDELDQFLTKSFQFADGTKIGISCTTIDSGGHYTDEVYTFCKSRENRRVFAIKGKAGIGLPVVDKPTRSNRKEVPLFGVGVDTCKELVMSRLKIEMEGPGYCHFPREQEKGFDEDYFKGLLSEKRVIVLKNGKKHLEWKKVVERNEPLDLEDYNIAALEILNPDFNFLERMLANRKGAPQQSQAAGARPGRRIISKGVS